MEFVRELDKKMPTQNLLQFTQSELNDFFLELGEKPYRTKQFMQWVYHHLQFDFADMSNFSKKLRTQIIELANLDLPQISSQKKSTDGVVKWLLELHDKSQIEAVYIPEKLRGTLCISSQVGCSLKCTFCSTGQQGFRRNLTTAEIIGQVLVANNYLKMSKKRITNVVFMGMGEPLLNEKSVYAACDLLLDDLAFGLSRRRVTISTSGIVPAMLRMADATPVSLAISLHSADDNLRDKLVPINQKYNIKKLLTAADNYLEKGEQQRHILVEYVMLDGVNDSKNQAQELAILLKGRSVKVNLIPFNSFPNTCYQVSKPATITNFQDILRKSGIQAMVRKTRGDDVDAACGQLIGKFSDIRKSVQKC